MQGKPFDIFRRMARAEWDTLLFFYGVVLCVGGLGFIGYLGLLSGIIYVSWARPLRTHQSVSFLSL
jgi:Na+/H+ antiporter NhaD/arsenite permease-like protein